MEKIFPKIKKEVKHFVADESGVISKKNLLKTGIAIGGILALAHTVSAHHVSGWAHTNTLTIQETDEGTYQGRHGHEHWKTDRC